MTYYSTTYANRITLNGDNELERLQFTGQEDFAKYLVNSPNKQTITIAGTDSDVVILTDRQTESIDRKILLATYNSNIDVGDYFIWNDSYWLVIIEETNSMNRYFRGFIKQCNHNLKWYDQYGNEYDYPIYFEDKNINFVFTANGTNELNIPDNKSTGTIVITKNTITLSTLTKGMKLVVGGQIWIVGSIDTTSSSGLIYIRVIESLLNEEEDTDLPDILDKPVWSIVVPQGNTISLATAGTLQLVPIILKDGVEQTGETLLYTSSDLTKFTVNSSGLISGVANGSGTCTIKMSNNLLVTSVINVTITSTVTSNIAYTLDGDQTIKWDQVKNYEVIKTVNGIPDTTDTFVLSNNHTDLVSLVSTNARNSTFTLTGNSNRDLGTATITIAIGATTVLTVPIEVVSLWSR